MVVWRRRNKWSGCVTVKVQDLADPSNSVDFVIEDNSGSGANNVFNFSSSSLSFPGTTHSGWSSNIRVVLKYWI